EYLFTLAGLLADVLVLRESPTFYRMHETNAFQISNGDPDAIRRKQTVLNALAAALRERFTEHQVPEKTASIVLDSVENEAELLKLAVELGLPWETIRTALRNYRIMQPHASAARWVFKCLALLPAC